MRCEEITAEARAPAAGLSCEICGCTEARACPGGCHWVSLDPPICSACAEIGADIQTSERGFFGHQRCPASPVPASHTLLWVDGSTGYCTRCREGFIA